MHRTSSTEVIWHSSHLCALREAFRVSNQFIAWDIHSKPCLGISRRAEHNTKFNCPHFRFFINLSWTFLRLLTFKRWTQGLKLIAFLFGNIFRTWTDESNIPAQVCVVGMQKALLPTNLCACIRVNTFWIHSILSNKFKPITTRLARFLDQPL